MENKLSHVVIVLLLIIIGLQFCTIKEYDDRLNSIEFDLKEHTNDILSNKASIVSNIEYLSELEDSLDNLEQYLPLKFNDQSLWNQKREGLTNENVRLTIEDVVRMYMEDQEH